MAIHDIIINLSYCELSHTTIFKTFGDEGGGRTCVIIAIIYLVACYLVLVVTLLFNIQICNCVYSPERAAS